MGRGRPKKLESLKELHGTLRKDRKQKQTFTASDSKFGIPRGLNQEVRSKVREVAHFLQDSGAPIEILRPIFERYCNHLQLCYLAIKDIDNSILKDGKKHPAAQIYKDNSQSALQIEQYFDKILKNTKPKEKKVDRLKEFLAKGKKLEALK